MNTLGNRLKVTVFGQSHAPSIGCVVEGLPAGFAPDLERLSAFMTRRAPGRNAWSGMFLRFMKTGAVISRPWSRMGRAKSVPDDKYSAVYAGMEHEMALQIDAAVAKGGAEA